MAQADPIDWTQALEGVRDALSALSGGPTLAALLALVAVATISMALVQLLKELTPLRRQFQQRWIAGWIRKRCDSFAEKAANGPPPRPECVQQELALLAAGGEACAFYDLPIEELVVQANAAGQIALDQPEDYWSLLAALSEGAAGTDLQLLCEGYSADAAQAFFDARSRVSRRIERNLQGMRIACGNRWKWLMLVLSVVLTTGMVMSTVAVHDSNARTLFLAAVLAIVGSYLAPVARDLLAAVQKLRRA